MLFSSGKSASKIDECGLRAANISANKDKFLEIVNEITNTLKAADDLVNLRAYDKKGKIEKD